MARTYKNRLLSIDAARGFAMFFLIGGNALLIGLAVLMGNEGLSSFLTYELGHAQWHGMTISDIWAPFYIFISGVSFVAAASNRGYINKKSTIFKSFKRCLILIFLGLIYNGLLFQLRDLSSIRVYSILGRIGIAMFLATLIYLLSDSYQNLAGWAIGITFVMFLLMRFCAAPDMPGFDSLSMEGNIEGYIDRLLFPGHLYNEYYDPEGLLSIIASVPTALSGMLAGKWMLCSTASDKKRRVVILGAVGALLMVLAYVIDPVFPINKRLYTLPYVLLTAGFGCLLFAIFFLLIELWGIKKGLLPLLAIGFNPLLAYLMDRFLNPVLWIRKFVSNAAFLADPRFGPFLTACIQVIPLIVVLIILYKKRIAIKI